MKKEIQIEKADNKNIELKRLEIENQKLIIETEKLKIEKSKQFWTILIGTLPLLGVILTIIYGIYVQSDNEENQFKLKAAEIIFNTSDAYEARVRADMLIKTFPNELPEDFSKSFNPDSLEILDTYEMASKKEVIRLIASHPENKTEIIKCWKQMFPGDEWIKDLEIKPDSADLQSVPTK